MQAVVRDLGIVWGVLGLAGFVWAVLWLGVEAVMRNNGETPAQREAREKRENAEEVARVQEGLRRRGEGK